MSENASSAKNEESERKYDFGPLKAVGSNEYQIEGEDWGGLNQTLCL